MKHIPVMNIPVTKPEKLDPEQIVTIKLADLNALRAEIGRLREALLFYADAKVYYVLVSENGPTAIMADNGTVARTALKVGGDE